MAELEDAENRIHDYVPDDPAAQWRWFGWRRCPTRTWSPGGCGRFCWVTFPYEKEINSKLAVLLMQCLP
jgi:hypothetical protein